MTIDEETLHKAKKQAAQAEITRTLTSIPKTAAGFEKDFTAVKKDGKALVEYLKGIPLPTLEGYFKKAEVSSELI